MQQTFSNKRRPHTRDEANDQDCDDRSHESGVRLFGLSNLQERVFTVGVLEEGVEGDALFHPREGDSKLGVLFKGLEDLSEWKVDDDDPDNDDGRQNGRKALNDQLLCLFPCRLV